MWFPEDKSPLAQKNTPTQNVFIPSAVTILNTLKKTFYFSTYTLFVFMYFMYSFLSCKMCLDGKMWMCLWALSKRHFWHHQGQTIFCSLLFNSILFWSVIDKQDHLYIFSFPFKFHHIDWMLLSLCCLSTCVCPQKNLIIDFKMLLIITDFIKAI